MKTVVSICSARPNFVKVAAVHHALAARPHDFKHVIIHTGQHYDPLFSDVFFEQLLIPLPDYNLGIHGGTREELIAATKVACEKILPDIHPDIVLVYGDVNGAVGGAEAAKSCGFKIGHVEAGLRSFDLSMPEELNRIAIDKIADLLFCSEESAVRNLKAVNVADEKIHLVGNTMIDTLIRMMPLIDAADVPALIEGSYAIATLHRPSNVDDPHVLRETLSFLSEVARHIPLVLPAHHRLTAAIETFHLEDAIDRHLILVPPMAYLSFLRCVKDAAFILTDSGGIQEEATYLRKKCFTLRRNTERPSTIESGSNTLVDIANHEDRHAILHYAAHPIAPNVTVPVLWDGKAGVRIVEILQN